MGKLDFDVAPPTDATLDAAAPVAAAVDGVKPMSNKEKRKESKKRKSREGEEAAAPVKVDEEATTAAGEAADGESEEKVLSHKEKRLAKKRKLAAEQAGEDPEAAVASVSSSKPAKPAANAPTTIGNTLVGNTPARSAHGVWVGNMNFATHPRELLAWFADRGLKDVTRINMPGGKRTHENNRGFAYLDFPSAAEVQIAIGLSEQHLDGRKLLIKDSSDYTGRPAASTSTATAESGVPSGSVKSVIATLDPSALERPHPNAASTSAAGGGANGQDAPSLNRTARKILSRQRNPAGPTLFLGNLGFETTVEDIRDMFDRNQRRASEWAPGGNPDAKKEKTKKGKGKVAEGEEEEEKEGSEGDDGEDESDAEAGGESGDEEDGSNDEDEQKKDRKGKKEKKKDRGPLDLSKAKHAGIRKVRLGTFEDSGKCKGWAFVDFHLPAQATRALLNLHNHQLNGRKLNVEFASAEAVRRGGLGTRSAVKRQRSQREQDGEGEDERGDGGYEGRGRGSPPRGGRRQDRHGGAEASSFGDVDVRALAIDAGSSAGAGSYGGPPPPRRSRDFGASASGERPPRREKEPLPGGKRAKPGAALAMAQRASEAIVQSTGRKTTFE
ncbi:hypothetical protein JCM10908_000993 [Rhodotorula pacifica]|uniref:uncharacterized protein n=1 Tax=Rhodotorula pacifica TaxID=1495444 RepID=UPI00317A7177